MRLEIKILRPDCCHQLILSHKSHYKFCLAYKLISEMQQKLCQCRNRGRRLTVVSVSRSDLWVGWRDDTQCYHQLCSALRLSPPTHNVVIVTRLMFKGKISFGWSLILCAQRSWWVCLPEMRASIFLSPSITIPYFVTEHLPKILLGEDWLGSAGLGCWR